jgi:hypothetical protein
VEKALSVKNNTKVDKYIEEILNTGFIIERADDMSFFIAPNLERFTNIAKVIFGVPQLF